MSAEDPTIYVEINGGTVRNVFVRGLPKCRYVVLDKDVEGCGDDEVFPLTAPEGQEPEEIYRARTFSTDEVPFQLSVDVEAMQKLMDAEDEAERVKYGKG